MDRYPPKALPTKCTDHIYGIGSSSRSFPVRDIDLGSSHLPFRQYNLQGSRSYCTCCCDPPELTRYAYPNELDIHLSSDHGLVDRYYHNRSHRRAHEVSADPYRRQKSSMSYVALISHAILNSQEQKSTLSEIYRYIEEAFPECIVNKVGWKNTVRHNLSLHECFVKGELAKNGKSCYWRIHPKYQKKFSKGEFKRRLSKDDIPLPGINSQQDEDHCQSKRESVVKAEPFLQGQHESSSTNTSASETTFPYTIAEKMTSSTATSSINPQLDVLPGVADSLSLPLGRITEYPPLGPSRPSFGAIGYHPGLFYLSPYFQLPYSLRPGFYR